ncbi:PREDICTED: mucin-5AC-like isoform X1 [Atta colombica]|nr:PREDICTED: mucin-5AC-like isoform X1 [Atta colombica]
MNSKIFVLFALVAVLGSFTEARFAFGYPYGSGEQHVDKPFIMMSRVKREIDDSNGESTTKPTTSQATTTSSTTDPTTTSSSTTPSSTTPSSTTPSSTTPPTSPTTTPSTEPTTTPTTTTEATSPTTTPTSTSASTPTSTSTTPTTLSTTPSTTPESTKPTSEKPSDIQPRSNVDEPEDSTKKPEPKNEAPTPGPFGTPGFGSGFGPGFGSGFGPGFGSGFGPGGYDSGFDPYAGFNSIPSYNPNYAWTGTNNGPGFASAGASAGSFGYPGYPMGFPTAASPTGYPTPSFSSRGGFQDNLPNQDNPLNKDDSPSKDISPNKNNSPNQNGFNFGGDPYNPGPGFFYPGQFPSFNDPTFNMIKQIQAQIEAQHKANMELHNRLANEAANYDGKHYGGGIPQVASASIGLGPYGGFQSGQISPASPGIESRFADDLPPPSGNSYGVFSSSSSSSMTGPDGRPINHKSSITGVNDNGKISYRTLYD